MSQSSVYHEPWGFVFRKTGRHLPDSLFIRLHYLAFWGYLPHLRHPRTMNEKISSLMLYDRRPIGSVLVDKVRGKEYVRNIIGDRYIIPTLGVWDKAADIDFDALPEMFILKCTHDSGSAIICRDKSQMDFDEVRRSLQKALDTDFYKSNSREWNYKDVPRRILAEPLLNPDGSHMDDWRFFCTGGEPRFVYVSTAGHINFLSLDWQFLPAARTDYPPQDTLPEKPSRFDEMLEISRALSKDYPFVRVDLYQVGEQVLFSELTLSPSGGLMPLETRQQDEMLGQLLDF